MGAYNDFLKTVAPTLLGLINSTTELSRDAYWKARHGPIQRVLSARYELTEVKNDYFDIVGSYEFALRSVSDKKDGSVHLRVTCKFLGHFHAASPVAREHAAQFADEDAWIVLWPYFRQFVSDITARMSIPPEFLPLGLGPGNHSQLRPSRSTTPPRALKAKNKATKPKRP
jgi:preprotein translocase subunit SecB